MLVLSHPRSGSTEICRIVELCLNTNSDVSISLGEFFNVGDRSSFGNTIDAYNHFRTSIDPITIKVIVLDHDKFKNRQIIKGREGQILPLHYLSETDITFSSSDELNNWFYAERIRRLELINSFKNLYNIKHFITLFDTPTDNEAENKFNRELIISQFKQQRLAFSYRKNLQEAVFSALIKYYYIDQARENNLENDFLNIIADGHNLHDMAVLEPRHIRIINALEDDGEFFNIEGIILTNLMLFEFYHLVISKLPIDNILCYEDIIETKKLTLTYQGKTQVYDINDLPPRVLYQLLDDGTTSRELIEKKMNYGDYAYEDYFTNSYVVHKVLEIEVNKIETRSPGFKETLSKLGIIY